MAFVTLIAQQALTTGERTFGPIAVSPSIKGVHIRLLRVNWPDVGGDVIRFSMDVSLDNSQTWINNWAGFTSRGGQIPDITRFGDLPNCTSARIKFPITGDNKRRLRFNLTIIESLTTEVAFEVF